MVTKIIKTHSVHNGHVKKTLTFSTEENNISNETQALPFNQSSAFYSPVAYGFFDWIEGAAGDVWSEIKSTGNAIVKGVEDVAEGIQGGNWDKAKEGFLDVIESPFAGHIDGKCAKISEEGKKLLLEDFAKKIIDAANKPAESAKEAANKINEGILDGMRGKEGAAAKVLEGIELLDGTHGEVIVQDVINSSKETFGQLVEFLKRGSDMNARAIAEDVEKAAQQGDLKGVLKAIQSIDHSSFMGALAITSTEPVLLEIRNNLNKFSNDLTDKVTQLNKDIEEKNLDNMLKEIEDLKQIDPEDTKLVNDQHSPTFEDDIEIQSEFIFF